MLAFTSKPDAGQSGAPETLAPLDRQLILLTQDGLPLVPRPFDALATTLGVSADEVKARFERMLANGCIRRIGAAPNHYRLGYRANAMTVWDVDDARVMALGERIGALPYVSHCYLRPRIPPQWPYNLFAMIHGKTREDLDGYLTEMTTLLGDARHASDLLLSTRILKKTGMRFSGGQ
ncbi:Lrp/AsnC family transcriptional regulator [Hahella aquimaris]|uniref:siroheme decarboxylase subunit beta n=1 Tax=Hahella sp. HNIBRBA332 TaxID=3015983 RepID=UPI00273B20F6|nr:Lrp/AsnC family transcriptional regulator [Hahella sp. HNIBRBA332]WLQ17265.1 Lrp/AsnC family transcriptional regulator [Hahella sp. HNIBRBA332]